MIKLLAATFIIGLTAASSAWAADGDVRVGTFEGWFCGAPATFEIHERSPDAWAFRGRVLIRDTGENDFIRINQYDDNTLRITRELSGANFGHKQTVETDPPVIEDGIVAFYSAGGRGPGCNNAGANSVLRIPLEPTYEFEEFEVVGQSPKQCERSMALCTNSMQATFGAKAPTVIAEKCTPLFQACMGNAQVAISQFAVEFGVEGKTREQCMASRHDCEARMLAEGYDASAVLGVCAPRLKVCLANAEGGGGGGTKGTIVADVTGYDSWDDPQDKCYLIPGSAVILLGTKPGDPNWKHLQGVEEVCDGEDFYLYDAGEFDGP